MSESHNNSSSINEKRHHDSHHHGSTEGECETKKKVHLNHSSPEKHHNEAG